MHRLTLGTRGRLSRALIQALRRRPQSPRKILDDAVSAASIELRGNGLSDLAVLAFLGELVEDAGRACGADRPSLMSGELCWIPVRTRVLGLAQAALDRPTGETWLEDGG
jgi:hypothetical protein